MVARNTFEKIYQLIDAIEPDEHGCKIWPRRPHAGGKVRVTVNSVSYFVPRLVLERKLGRAIRPGFFALHHCDWPSCVNEDHLYEGTYSDNRKDQWERNAEYAEERRKGLMGPENRRNLEKGWGWNKKK